MKILLVGEFSGVHNNLKDSLISQGHQVVLAADGDGFKKLNYDINLVPSKGSVFSRLYNVLYLWLNIKKFIGYDVIQFISPFSIPYYYNLFFIQHLLMRFNRIKVYYACGTDPSFLDSYNKFKYFPLDDVSSLEYPKYNFLQRFYYNYFINKIDYIVPSSLTYKLGYILNSKLSKVIMLPADNRIVNRPPHINGKIKILYGITRSDFKGSKFILKALDRIKVEFKHSTEVIIVEKLPFSEYKEILSSVDILIDQCKSYDYGMNAIFALKYGVIVLSGAEEPSIKELGIDKSPIINITPNVDEIYIEICKLLKLDIDVLYEMKCNSQKYVEKYHNSSEIARKFIDLYEKIN